MRISSDAWFKLSQVDNFNITHNSNIKKESMFGVNDIGKTSKRKISID